MALGATQRRWWRGDGGICQDCEKIYIRTVLKMPKLVFSSICPRLFPDLMGVSNSHWLELSGSRTHHIIFTTSKSWVFSTEGVRVCCFGMVLLGKVNTFSRFCSWWSFLLVTFPLWMRAVHSEIFQPSPSVDFTLLLPVPSVSQILWITYLFYNALNTSWKQWEQRIPSTSQKNLSTLQYRCLWACWVIDLVSLWAAS